VDEDRIEVQLGLLVLTGGAVGYAGTLLLPTSPAGSWAAVLLSATATLFALRREDLASLSMARRLRLSFAFVFGFVVTWQVYPAEEWSWWMPVECAILVFLAALPLFPSRSQRGRMARTIPLDARDLVSMPAAGPGWWWAFYSLLGIEVSILLAVLRHWGWVRAIALFVALTALLLPLRKMAKRRESEARASPPSERAVRPLFPDGPA